jgi:hypothetical protein
MERSIRIDPAKINAIADAWEKTRVCFSPFLDEWIRAGLDAPLIHALGLAPHPVVFSLLDAPMHTIIRGLGITPAWIKDTYPGESIDLYAMFRADSCRAMLFPDAHSDHAIRESMDGDDRYMSVYDAMGARTRPSFMKNSTLFNPS